MKSAIRWHPIVKYDVIHHFTYQILFQVFYEHIWNEAFRTTLLLFLSAECQARLSFFIFIGIFAVKYLYLKRRHPW